MTPATTRQLVRDEKAARSYNILSDYSPHVIDLAQWQGRDTIMEGAGGVKSSVRDLLRLYQALLFALNCVTAQDETALVRGQDLVQPRTFFNYATLREYFYALGLIRTELSAHLGTLGTNTSLVDCMPMVGEGLPSRLCIYHQGLQPESSTAVDTFPESDICIVTFQNSSAPCHCADWVSQHCIQTGTAPSAGLPAFYGRYWNESEKFLVLIRAAGNSSSSLGKPSWNLHFRAQIDKSIDSSTTRTTPSRGR